MSTKAKIAIALVGALLAVAVAGGLGIVIGQASAAGADAPLVNALPAPMANALHLAAPIPTPAASGPATAMTPGPGGIPAFGKITAIGTDSITVETRNGMTVTLKVDGNTKYNRITVTNIDLSGLKVGDTIAGLIQKQADGTSYAAHITAVPQSLLRNLGLFLRNLFFRRAIINHTVTIQAINGNILTVQLKDGTSKDITVADNAVIRLGRNGATLTLADLKAGQTIVTDAPLGQANPVAHHIFVRPTTS